MPLLNLIDVDYSVGGPLLLNGIDFAVEPGERVCIVGRNGAGKSTLLKLVAAEVVPDDGERRIQAGVRIAKLAQEVPRGMSGTVFDVVAEALGHLGELLARYHHLTHDGEFDADELSRVQAAIESEHGWDLERRVSETLTRLSLPEDVDFSTLSGGMKRRVLLARALVLAPDILLLDEPTNHLDIEAIDWLEQLLLGFPGSVVFITHDRRFLRALATRIVEIDRGKVTSWPGDYDNYLRRREERLHAEAQENALFDRKLAQEEVWIRQGIKARRTRNEGRVRALEDMRRERAQRRELTGNVKLETASAGKSGRRVIEAKDISYAFADKRIVRDFSTTIMRGDRVGLIGPNGSGKTTLIKLLLGDLQPQSGEVRLGTQLEVAYFDQYRAVLREDLTALDNVAEGQEFIEIGGSRKHVLGYLQDFLFSPERARAPITALSGGERNRLLLAKLFARPSNFLVMDEPTNDLDVETLELLEELLASYSGTLLLVSHDREFLDNVVSSTIVLEGNGRVGEYVGGYSDWLRQRPRDAGRSTFSPLPSSDAKPAQPSPVSPAPSVAPAAAPKRKLSYKEQRELAELPGLIEKLETEIAAKTAAMQDPAFYSQSAPAITAANLALSELQAKLDAAYARWSALDG